MVVTHPSLMLAGRYRLEGVIATGGVGEVWRATDLVLNRPVAVKLLRSEYASHPETLARFRAEARHAGSLSDPGVAQVYDYGEAPPPGSPYLVMELVNGPSLAGVLASGPLDPARTMDVVAQTASGLAAAHAVGLVHRDVKPANLLLAPGGQVKITDFGIAHAAGSAPVTRAGTLVGTPAYLAPERSAGAPATPASDLYSLGVVGYECLAGTAPFRGDPLEVAAAHQHRPLPLLPPTAPTAVAALIGELTAKDPAARPATAAIVAARAARLRDTMAGGSTVVLAGDGSVPSGRAAAGAAFGRQAGATGAGPRQWAPGGAGLAGDGRGTPGGAGSATLVDMQAPGAPSTGPPPRRGASWSGRRVALTLALAMVIAGLAGWMLASGSGAGPQQPAAPQASAAASASPSPGGVAVDGAALTGQPVAAVVKRLRQLGLNPRVVWAPGAAQPPGTVVSVQPTGQVPAGAVVVVTAAPGLHGHGHGHDQGGNSDN